MYFKRTIQSFRSGLVQPRRFSSTPARASNYEDFRNILGDGPRPAVEIQSSTDKGTLLADGLFIPSPCVVVNGQVFLWDTSPPFGGAVTMKNVWEAWDEKAWKLFEIVSPRPEILLLGTGRTTMLPHPSIRKYLNGLGIQLDVQDSRNAASTYNLLAEEGRRVAVALASGGQEAEKANV